MSKFVSDSDRMAKAKLLLSAIREAGYDVVLKNDKLSMKGPAGERKEKFIEAAKPLKKELTQILGGTVEVVIPEVKIAPDTPVEWLDADYLPHETTYGKLWQVPWFRWRQKKRYRFLTSYFAQPWIEREGMVPDVSCHDERQSN